MKNTKDNTTQILVHIGSAGVILFHNGGARKI
jgi:hypothetical protein